MNIHILKSFTTVGTKFALAILLLASFFSNSFINPVYANEKAKQFNQWESSVGHEYNWKNLLLSAMSLYRQFPYYQFSEAYLKNFYPKKWARFHNDEFMWNQIRAEAVKQMSEEAEKFRNNPSFEIKGQFYFGEYDFEKQQFDFMPFTQDTSIGLKVRQSHGFPNSFIVELTNYNLINGISMNEESAKSLISLLARSNNNILVRKVYGKIKFTFQGLKERKFTFPETTIYATIDRMTLYSDPSHTNLIAFYDLTQEEKSTEEEPKKFHPDKDLLYRPEF